MQIIDTPASLTEGQAATIRFNNDQAFRSTLNNIGSLMGQGRPVTPIEAMVDYSLFVPKFQAKFFSLPCHGKRVPLYFTVVRDEQMNEAMVGTCRHALDALDLEVFWAYDTEHPSVKKCDGSCNSYNMNLTLSPFGLHKFAARRINFGLYSRSGMNIRLGCSFLSDYFASTGQL